MVRQLQNVEILTKSVKNLTKNLNPGLITMDMSIPPPMNQFWMLLATGRMRLPEAR